MSHKKHQIWVMMPVLGLLLMSPKDIQSKYGRHIASDREPAPTQESAKVQSESKTPKLDALLPKSEIENIEARQDPVNLNTDMLKEDISSALSRVVAAEKFEKETVTKEQLDKLRAEIKASAIELVHVERNIPDVLSNKMDVEDVPERIRLARLSLEASLIDLESTEAVVAARPAKENTPATVAATSTPQRSPSVVESETTVSSDTKKEDKKEEKEKDPILCALEEQNKLLQQQLQGFVQQQTMIMQQLMQMSQMMMLQGMYQSRDTFNYNQAYQYYQPPMVAGNWVYYPDGQGIQPPQVSPQANIFGMQPPSPYMSAPQGGDLYGLQRPGILDPGQGQWTIPPQSSFVLPQGNFGMPGTVSSSPMPTLTFI